MLTAPDYPLTGTLAPLASGRAGVWQTVRLMRAAVDAAKVQPELLQFTRALVFLTPEQNELSEVGAIFDFVSNSIRYVRDVVGVETLADPLTTLRARVGDCDDQSTLLAAMLECVGYPTRFIVAGYQSHDFEHVYVQVWICGQWVDLDPTEHNGIGWAPPSPVVIRAESR